MQHPNPIDSDSVFSFSLDPRAEVAALATLLDKSFHSLADLVAISGMPRRQVENLLRSFSAEKKSDAQGNYFRLIAPSLSAASNALNEYRQYQQRMNDSLDETLVRQIDRWLQEVPQPKANLDHVQATTSTVFNRVKFLVTEFDLRNRTVVFVGDHDLTSLCLRQVSPSTNIIVLDIDDDLLNYLADASGGPDHRKPNFALYFCDFRFGTPPNLNERADLIFSDPPYTPEGLQLFVKAGLTLLRKEAYNERIVLAYGHSRIRPDSAVGAQSTLSKLSVAINAMLPGFNAYHGAEAIGSRADLYVCQPTAKAPRAGDRRGGQSDRSIYTHGASALESTDSGSQQVDELLIQLLDESAKLPDVTLAIDDGYGHRHIDDAVRKIRVQTLVERGIAAPTERLVLVVRADQSHRRVLRLLLASGAVRFDTVNVIQHAPTKSSWNELQRDRSLASDMNLASMKILEDKFDASSGLRVTQLSPSVASTAHEPWLFVLNRPHGSLQNLTRESLVRSSNPEQQLTKREAAEIVKDSAIFETFAPGQRLVDLPLSQIRALKKALEQTAVRLRDDNPPR